MAADGKGPTSNFCNLGGEVWTTRTAPSDLKQNVFQDTVMGIENLQAKAAAADPNLQTCTPKDNEISTGVKVQPKKAPTLKM